MGGGAALMVTVTLRPRAFLPRGCVLGLLTPAGSVCAREREHLAEGPFCKFYTFESCLFCNPEETLQKKQTIIAIIY